MIPAPAHESLGKFRMTHGGALTAGMQTTIVFEYETGAAGLRRGARIRVGVPNTGWEQPIAPQQRYWDELVQGADRRLAPFHAVNTTAAVEGRAGAEVVLDVMERMLAPDEDPALAYWRWWITGTLEGADLAPGDTIRITYGDTRFGSEGVRVQAFPENSINVTAYVQAAPAEPFFSLSGSPVYFDVVAGAPARANVIAPSTYCQPEIAVRISLTDASHCRPAGDGAVALRALGQHVVCVPGSPAEIRVPAGQAAPLEVFEQASGVRWGCANPSVPAAGGLNLYWGDLHAQSEHHVMHSQKMDFRQRGWSKGISCGTLDECYQYGRDVACLDFVAMTDQGACLTDAWEFCQGKAAEYNQPGRFVTFKGYEAGAACGHRNVIYATGEIEAPLDRARFHGFHPTALFDYYRERGDAILIPHHVKTWTDWTFHDPELEPVMEVYSCWGQSEAPGLDLWNKGMTPGAGAWEAFARGYRMGMIASSDNHAGMPGRSYPGDRQAHTPFQGGLCAIWAEELTRASLFSALRRKRCYGTTGARIIVRFSIDGQPMGSTVKCAAEGARAHIEIHGTDELRGIEVVGPQGVARVIGCARGEDRFNESVDLPAIPGGFYYLRIRQAGGERAWTSPVFLD